MLGFVMCYWCLLCFHDARCVSKSARLYQNMQTIFQNSIVCYEQLWFIWHGNLPVQSAWIFVFCLFITWFDFVQLREAHKQRAYLVGANRMLEIIDLPIWGCHGQTRPPEVFCSSFVSGEGKRDSKNMVFSQGRRVFIFYISQTMRGSRDLL